jgi:hypothetical protein
MLPCKRYGQQPSSAAPSGHISKFYCQICLFWYNCIRLGGNLRRSVFILIILFETALFAQENLGPGRTLPGGIWQPENTKATLHYQEPVNGDTSNPFLPLTYWGEDIRLTNFDPPDAHWSEIAASGNYINVAWWYLMETLYIVTSTDGGYTWINRQLTDDSTTNAVIPQIAASGSNVYVVYPAARPNQGVYLNRSSDYGVTWLPTQRIYYTARNYGESPVITSKDSMVYISADIEVNYVPPNQNWVTWLFRSRDFGQTWPDTFFVSDTTSSGLGPDLAVNNIGLHLIRGYGLISSNVMEVLYSGSSDGGETWFGPIMVSDNDSSGSFWPQIAAWGDSNVAVSWTDYKASPEEWSGDAFFSKSTDDGHTWSAPYQLTFSHGVEATDITASGDTIIITYNDYQNGSAAIYAIVSLDEGESWQEELRISDSSYYCSEPSVTMSNGLAHISWSQSMNIPNIGHYEIYYDRGSISSGIWQDESALPEDDLLISSYPNPFNSNTTITISGLKGGEAKIVIYDLTGRLVKEFDEKSKKGGDIKEVWDATDNSGKAVSSGIYFAKLQNNASNSSIKLVYLK